MVVGVLKVTHFVSHRCHRERPRNELTDVFRQPQDGFNHAHGHFSLSEVEENSTEAIGFALSGQIPSDALTKADSFPISAKQLLLLLLQPV